MILKLRPLLYAFIFFIGLELTVFEVIRPLIAVVVLVLIAIFAGKKIGHAWKFSILPVFFTLFSMAMSLLISTLFEEQVFIVLATGMYYLGLLGTHRLSQCATDQTAKGMLMATTSATIFFAFTGAYGLYLNFLVPLFVLMLTYGAIALLVSYQYFSIIETNQKKVWMHSLLLALVMAEIVWTMNFWPFGYLTTGAIALILYYVLWDLIQSYFLDLLSKKRVVANMAFFSVVVVVVLLSAKWIPVI